MNGERTNTKIPEYQVWKGMRARCRNPNHIGYRHYGARGIEVCKRWESFKNFITDMGRRPDESFTIERLDNERGYSPENCRWVSRIEQSHNSRKVHKVLFMGEMLCIMDVWRRIKGAVKYQTLVDRINKGWSIQDSTSPELFP